MVKLGLYAALAFGVLSLLPGSASAASCATGVVSTTGGAVCGIIDDAPQRGGVEVFRGIPYGDSVSGPHRWTPPRPSPGWSGLRVADAFGPSCPQAGTSGPGAEDCLFLNVWRPKGTAANAALPVMVFIHGGGFYGGTGADPLYNGARLAADGVIVVSLNYRLGALGWLAYRGADGNYGLLDQQLALAWVGANAAAFGGDPRRITVFGESAGAISIGLHLEHMPASRPLFARAIMESNLLGVPIRSVSQAKGLGELFASSLACADLACLRQADLAKLIAASDAFRFEAAVKVPGLAQIDVWAPNFDDTLVHRRPLSAGKPVVLGYNGDEGTLFVAPFAGKMSKQFYLAWLGALYGERAPRIAAAYPPPPGDASVQAARVLQDSVFSCPAQAKAAKLAHAHLYEFTLGPSFNLIPLPQCGQRPCHTYELPFVFGNADLVGAAFTPEEQALSTAMRRMWTGFARTGAVGPEWPSPRQGQAMLFDRTATPGRAAAAHCQLWRGGS